jgi:ketosteroid isomerase-like protein
MQGEYSMTMQMPDGTSMSETGKFLEIRRKQADGRWLLSHDMFSPDAAPPMP